MVFLIDCIIYYLVLGCLTMAVYCYAKHKTQQFLNKMGYDRMKEIILLLNPDVTEVVFEKTFGKNSTVTIYDLVYVILLWPLVLFKYIARRNRYKHFKNGNRRF